jgi:putative nucleotidyltransferase with HDIG domain
MLTGGIILAEEKIFLEIEQHLLHDKEPSKYLNEILNMGYLEGYPYTMISSLKNIGQSEKYHPEGNVWNHTMLVIDEAAQRKDKSKDLRVFMWAALLHDIGKTPTTKLRKGRITAYGHEKEGSRMTVEFLKNFSEDSDFIKSVALLVRWHMEPLFSEKALPFSNIKDMLEQVSLDELVLLSLCDRLGRGDMDDERKAEEEKGIHDFVRKCRIIGKGNII